MATSPGPNQLPPELQPSDRFLQLKLKKYNILYYTILYYTILYYTILYYTILYYTILYYSILYYTILYYTVLYYTILYHAMLCPTLLYNTFKTARWQVLHPGQVRVVGNRQILPEGAVRKCASASGTHGEWESLKVGNEKVYSRSQKVGI